MTNKYQNNVCHILENKCINLYKTKICVWCICRKRAVTTEEKRGTTKMADGFIIFDLHLLQTRSNILCITTMHSRKLSQINSFTLYIVLCLPILLI